MLNSHIVVKLGDYYIDNNGIHDQKWIGNNIDKLPLVKLKEMISMPELWNHAFDTHIYNNDPTIERISDKMINDIYLI
jgi:hypothetical protein